MSLIGNTVGTKKQRNIDLLVYLIPVERNNIKL